MAVALQRSPSPGIRCWRGGAATLACAIAACGAAGDSGTRGVVVPADPATPPGGVVSGVPGLIPGPAAGPGATVRDLGDGRALAILGVVPTLYRDDDGAYKPVSDELIPTRDGGWENRTNTLRSFLPAVATGAVGVDRREVGPLSFVPRGMAWCDARNGCTKRERPSPVTGVADDRVPGRLAYPAVHADVDEEFRVLAFGLKHDVVLTAPPVVPAGVGEDGYLSFAWDLRLGRGMVPWVGGKPVSGQVSTRGAIVVRDGAGVVRMSIAPPRLVAGGADPHHPDRTTGTYSITARQGGWDLELRAPLGWLLDVARSYPIRLDPTVVVQPEDVGHTGAIGFDGDSAYNRDTGRIVSGTLTAISPGFDDVAGYARFPTGAVAQCMASVEEVDLLIWLANHDNYGVEALPLDMEVRAAAVDPVTATDQEVFEAIGAGAIYVADEIPRTTGPSGNWCADAYVFREYDLGPTAAADFTAGLAGGSFTIGFLSEIGEDLEFDHIDYIGYPEDVSGACGFEPLPGTRVSLRVTGTSKAAPIANAGGPYTATCASSETLVPLDGSASVGSPLSYAWATDCPGGTFDDANSPTPVLAVSLGGACSMACAVTLTVADGCAVSTATAAVSIGDASSPVVTPGPLDGACLWSPNHKYVCTTDLRGFAQVEDECSSVVVAVAGCASDQPDEAPDPDAPGENGDGHTTGDCVIAPDALSFCVRSERLGTHQAGRHYGVALVAEDGCSPATPFSGSFYVPHDQSPHEDCVDPSTSPFLEVHHDLPWAP